MPWSLPGCLLALAIGVASLDAQSEPESSAGRISMDGVSRAAALVDSVYIDRRLSRATVEGGDFAAYLLARLGMRVIPPDFGYRVAVDTSRIRIGGRVSDLPWEARQSLSQLVYLLPPATRLEAEVELQQAGREAVRFHLARAVVQGIPVPEAFLASLMADVGGRYPALTHTGRDLYVQIPAGARMALVPGGVELTGP